jgi:hypothetical protein
VGRPWKFEWNEEKIEAMKKYYPTGEYELLFEALGYNDINSVRHMAKKLNLSADFHYYSDEDLKFIKENYMIMGNIDIGKILNRPPATIQRKANEMGLIKYEKWTDEEIELLKEKYPDYSNEYLAENIFPNRSKNSVNIMSGKLGLQKSEEKNNKFYDKAQMIDELKRLAEKLNRTPLVEELSANGLPSSKSYERYFDGYKNACRLAGLEINVSLYGKAKIYYSSTGDVCFSMAELIVTEFFIENKIQYTKDIMYREIISDKRCGTKRTDWILKDGSVVEYWGYPNVDDYDIGVALKIKICEDNNINLIQLVRKNLTKLHEVFSQYL